jgi:hypothetical protein
MARRFPLPWAVEELNGACFIVRDHNGEAGICHPPLRDYELRRGSAFAAAKSIAAIRIPSAT